MHNLVIPPFSEEAAQKRLDALAKVPRSLGRLEGLARCPAAVLETLCGPAPAIGAGDFDQAGPRAQGPDHPAMRAWRSEPARASTTWAVLARSAVKARAGMRAPAHRTAVCMRAAEAPGRPWGHEGQGTGPKGHERNRPCPLTCSRAAISGRRAAGCPSRAARAR